MIRPCFRSYFTSTHALRIEPARLLEQKDVLRLEDLEGLACFEEIDADGFGNLRRRLQRIDENPRNVQHARSRRTENSIYAHVNS